MTDANRPGSPTRRALRVHHEVMVGVTSDQGTISGWGTNLSIGGVFVNSGGNPPKDTAVSVLLQLPGMPECKLKGRVAWSQATGPGVDEPGFGIEFVEPDEETKKRVGEMVDKLSHDLSRAPA